jgi:signal peptidase II
MIYSLISLLCAAGLAGIDRVIKLWAVAYLQPVGAMPVIPGVVELRYVLNDGCAFSLLSGKQGFLILITCIALAVVLWMLFKRKLSVLERVAWTLIFAGGVGNLIDRVLYRQVVDYINPLFVKFAVFNFADICVTIGVCFLILALIVEECSSKKNKNASSDSEKEPRADNGSV